MTKEKIRIHLQSFHSPVLNESCQKIIQTVFQIDQNSIVKGPVPLPTRRRIYCVLRSPHVNKDSREQFEIRRHKRVIDIYSNSEQIIDALVKIEMSPAISTKIVLLKN